MPKAAPDTIGTSGSADRGGDVTGHRGAVPGGGARADHRDRPVEGVEPLRPAHPQPDRHSPASLHAGLLEVGELRRPLGVGRA